MRGSMYVCVREEEGELKDTQSCLGRTQLPEVTRSPVVTVETRYWLLVTKLVQCLNKLSGPWSELSHQQWTGLLRFT